MTPQTSVAFKCSSSQCTTTWNYSAKPTASSQCKKLLDTARWPPWQAFSLQSNLLVPLMETTGGQADYTADARSSPWTQRPWVPLMDSRPGPGPNDQALALAIRPWLCRPP